MNDEQNEKLNGADAANFGNDHAATEGAGGYIANFNGDEINGQTYQMGDRIAGDVDAGTLAYLVQNGRITPTSEPDGAPAGGQGGTGVPDGDDGDDGQSTSRGDASLELSDEEQAEADKLVADHSADELRAMIAEGEPTSGTKADLAARIVAAKR